MRNKDKHGGTEARRKHRDEERGIRINTET